MADTGPALPENPALRNDDSMLTKRFGKEVVNYYAGGRLNRYSFLRSDTPFLSKAATSPQVQYLALDNLNAYLSKSGDLAYFSFDDLKPLLGPEPFNLTEDELVAQFDSSLYRPLVIFLGMLEGGGGGSLETSQHGTIHGQPFFAVDVTPRPSNSEVASTFKKSHEEKGGTIQSNPRSMSLQAEAAYLSAAIYAQARAMMDWNLRNAFCAGCGSSMLSVHAGYKRMCPPTDRNGSETAQPRGECATRKGVSNICFPRTDPTMIAAVVSADGERILLGRQKRWPPCWYSTLAGFIEPGESIEESVRREVWEESGVKVGRVVIHSSQPWPYPNSLMIGAIAQALPGDNETITLNDKELEYAKWFSIQEVRKALATGTTGLDAPPPADYKEGDLRLPPAQAIANQLITAAAAGYVSGGSKI
ncbi:hypothetical protein S40285_07182 [Stachybotrys chlorohalonatus IBT 40285]|uniref:NAD(+) diphosphatase n=1 Tax=Stachybotrys chlorohalonatus (strain IBT 40285) TaxID=1283841 RepID=A0A084QPV1_STAC4|nr:hypothetical protein S40285_07182 [Stachybotrys chlorohalonata IBT 40285]